MTRDEVLERDAVLDERAFYLQRAFRALLDAFAHPGEVEELNGSAVGAEADAQAAGLFPSTIVVVDVLLDAATTVAVAGEGAAACERVLTRRTHVLTAAADEAAYAVVPLDVTGDEARAFVCSLTPGTLLDPHLGATCVVECATLLGRDAAGAQTGSAAGAQQVCTCGLSGPGIATTASFSCDRVDVLEARATRADEFPCGIDIVLVDKAGHVVAVPRTSAVTLDAGQDGKGATSWDM